MAHHPRRRHAWMEESVQAETAQRAFDTGDKAALTKALQSGAVRVKAG